MLSLERVGEVTLVEKATVDGNGAYVRIGSQQLGRMK